LGLSVSVHPEPEGLAQPLELVGGPEDHLGRARRVDGGVLQGPERRQARSEARHRALHGRQPAQPGRAEVARVERLHLSDAVLLHVGGVPAGGADRRVRDGLVLEEIAPGERRLESARHRLVPVAQQFGHASGGDGRQAHATVEHLGQLPRGVRVQARQLAVVAGRLAGRAGQGRGEAV